MGGIEGGGGGGGRGGIISLLGTFSLLLPVSVSLDTNHPNHNHPGEAASCPARYEAFSLSGSGTLISSFSGCYWLSCVNPRDQTVSLTQFDALQKKTALIFAQIMLLLYFCGVYLRIYMSGHLVLLSGWINLISRSGAVCQCLIQHV